MERHYPEIEAAGLRVVAVGIGEPKHARRYCGQLAPSIDCLCHATPAVHQRYGLKHNSMLEMMDMRIATHAMRAAAGGFVQGKSTGDTQQLGGTFIVDTMGVIQYAYVSGVPGDNPDLTRLLRNYRRSQPE